MKKRIMKPEYRIVTKKTSSKDYSYCCVRFYFTEGGRTPWKVLKNHVGETIKPPEGILDFVLLPEHIKEDCRNSVFQVVQSHIEEETPLRPVSKYRTLGKALADFLDEYQYKHMDKTVRNKAKQFEEYFGSTHPEHLTHEKAKKFAEWVIEQGGKNGNPLAFDTVRHRVNIGYALVEWLKERREWRGDNPFDGIMKKYARMMPVKPSQRYIVEDDEYEKLYNATLRNERYKVVRIFIEVARCTGLRPAEIERLDTKDIDRNRMTWKVYTKKGVKRSFYREIPIPRCLLVFIDNEGVCGKLEFCNIKDLFPEVRSKANLPNDIQMKTFRKDFATRMVQVSGDVDSVKYHQGRNLGDVTNRSYLDDGIRVEKCRNIISIMFGEKARISAIS